MISLLHHLFKPIYSIPINLNYTLKFYIIFEYYNFSRSALSYELSKATIAYFGLNWVCFIYLSLILCAVCCRDPDQVQDVLEDIREQQDISKEISDALSTPVCSHYTVYHHHAHSSIHRLALQYTPFHPSFSIPSNPVLL